MVYSNRALVFLHSALTLCVFITQVGVCSQTVYAQSNNQSSSAEVSSSTAVSGHATVTVDAKKEKKLEEKSEKKLEKTKEKQQAQETKADEKVAKQNQKIEKKDDKQQKTDKKVEKIDSSKGKSDVADGKTKVRVDAPCLSWVKVGVPLRAVLLCVHGLGLNSDSWKEFGQAMSAQGIATYAIDVRGFGSWEKAQGHEKCDFSGCVKDTEVTLDWLHKANPKKPVFLMGESMGGAIALHVAAQAPELIDGVVSVCSSGDRFKQKRTEIKVFLHMLVGPTKKFDIGDKIVSQAAKNDPKLKREWEGDALDQMKLSPVELMQFQHFMNENHDEAKKITKLPVLMVQGRQDPLVKPEGTQELFNELKTPDKQIMMVENAKHLIFEENQFTTTSLNAVAKWIFRHCQAAQTAQAAPVSFDDAMEKARTDLDGGDMPDALRAAQIALKLNAKDPNAHYLMGLIRMRLNQPLIARGHLIQAARLGKGTQVAKDANKTLLTLPQNVMGSRQLADANKRLPVTPGALPSVVVFSASWCQPGQDMNAVIAQAKTKFGKRVKFQMLDVDDPANAALVDHYSIGPVPTTVFLAPNGDVVTFQVGNAGLDGMTKGIQRILAPR